MKKTGFYSKQLIEIFTEHYPAGNHVFSNFDYIINNEDQAFKMIRYITQIEIITSDEDLDYRKNIIPGSCYFALELLSENPKANLLESFLKKCYKPQSEDS